MTKDEAAMLIGMCKNPAIFNPHTYQIKNYRTAIARDKGIAEKAVKLDEIAAARAEDSLRAVTRRNQVLMQWLKNSKKKNAALRVYITEDEYKTLSQKPLVCKYQEVDHKRGMAPYFREGLRKELTELLTQKNPDGSFKFRREDGAPCVVYRDWETDRKSVG